MKTANVLQDLLTKTAQRYEFDLGDTSICYRLEDRFGTTITVQRESDTLLRVGEYKDYGDGSLTGDPEFLIFTGGAQWVQVGCGEHGRDFMLGAVLSSDGKEVLSVISQTQSQIAEKYEAWVRQLSDGNSTGDKTDLLIPTWLT